MTFDRLASAIVALHDGARQPFDHDGAILLAAVRQLCSEARALDQPAAFVRAVVEQSLAARPFDADLHDRARAIVGTYFPGTYLPDRD